MAWKEDVRSRFSPQEDSVKWDRMYGEETENLEDEFFRLRRDFTVAYVAAHYGTDAAICDLGCGAGPVISVLLERGYDPVGLDYSADMLRNAATRIATGTPGRRPLARSDIQALPLRDESFDCAICLGVISYVEHYENIIREIRRILKPGGTAIVTYRNEKNLVVSDPVGPFRYAAKKTLRALGLASRTFRIGHYMSFKEVRRALQRNGLTVEAFEGIGFGPLRLNNRPLLSEKTSLKIHRALARWMEGAEFPFRIGADVHIFVVRKSEGTTASAT
jgi:ubiquinone/menaquinone biosynthesis C-methylase UbiE